jgi:hypothetical protein
MSCAREFVDGRGAKVGGRDNIAERDISQLIGKPTPYWDAAF